MQKRLLNPFISAFLTPSIFFILWVLSAEKAVSQTNSRVEGYYLDLKKDTIRGLFNFDDLEQNRVAFYQNKATEDYTTLRPNDILAINAVNNIKLITFNYGYAKSLFLSTLFSSKITLYKTYFEGEGLVFFINTLINPEIIKIEKDKPKAFFDTYFEACKVPESAEVKYVDSSLIAAVSTLNKCANLEKKKKVIRTNRTKSNVSLGIKTGVMLERPELLGFYEGRYDKLNTSYRGLFLTFYLPHNFSIKTGVNFYSKTITKLDTLFKALYDSRSDGYTLYFKTPFAFSYNAFELPLELTYCFKNLSRKYTPMLSIGGSVSRKSELKVLRDFPEFYKFESTLGFPAFAFPSVSITANEIISENSGTYLFAATGVKIIINRHIDVDLNAQYGVYKSSFTSIRGFTKIRDFTTIKSNRLDFSLSCAYRF